VVDAERCAVEIQNAMVERNAGVELSLSPQITSSRCERDRLDLGVDAHPFRHFKCIYLSRLDNYRRV
jgi:hypothetical protein